MDLLKSTLIVVGFLTGVFFIAKASILPTYPDFSVYYTSSQLLLRGEDPYVAISSVLQMTFLYPPTFLLVVYPFAYIPISYLQIVWFVVSLACFIVSVFVMLYLLNIRKTFEILALVTLTLFMFPVKFTFGMGQINHIVLLFVVLSMYGVARNRENLGAGSLAGAISLKLFPLLLVPYLFVRKKWRLLITFFSVTSTWFVLSVLVLGSESVMHFFTNALPAVSSSWPEAYYNQALTGFLVRLIDEPDTRHILRLVAAGGFLAVSSVAVIRTLKNREAVLLHLSLIPILTLMLQSFSWQHHFVLLIPSFLILYATIKKTKNRLFHFLVLGAAYILVAANAKNPDSLPVILQSHVFYGALLVWMLNLLLLRQYDA